MSVSVKSQAGPAPRIQATFAFVDLAGFTALTEAQGDEDAADVAVRFATLARAALGTARSRAPAPRSSSAVA